MHCRAAAVGAPHLILTSVLLSTHYNCCCCVYISYVGRYTMKMSGQDCGPHCLCGVVCVGFEDPETLFPDMH